MIKQDKGESTRSGGPDLNMSELALLTIVIQEEICETTSMTVEQFDADIASSIRVNRLIRAGMSPEEALEVSGFKDRLKSMKEVAKDGTVREIDLDK